MNLFATQFVEVAVTADTNLSGWTLYYYNGSNGQSYATSSLSGVAPSSGVAVVSVAKAGIQNGGSDGFALVDNSNNVVQFLSYEGTVMALDGPANGMLSTDIGVQETSSRAGLLYPNIGREHSIRRTIKSHYRPFVREELNDVVAVVYKSKAITPPILDSGFSDRDNCDAR